MQFVNRDTGNVWVPITTNQAGSWAAARQATVAGFWTNPPTPHPAAAPPVGSRIFFVEEAVAAGPVDLDLQSSAGAAAGTAEVKAATDVVPAASAAAAAGAASVLAAVTLQLATDAAVAAGAAAVKAATSVLLAAAPCVCSASAAIEAGEQAPASADRMRDGHGI